MTGLQGVSGGGVSRTTMQSQLQITALRQQKNMMKEQGEMAVKLIQSAKLDPAVGNHLNVVA